jgi:hypothetical protein
MLDWFVLAYLDQKGRATPMGIAANKYEYQKRNDKKRAAMSVLYIFSYLGSNGFIFWIDVLMRTMGGKSSSIAQYRLFSILSPI